jgi:hypothetical protein
LIFIPVYINALSVIYTGVKIQKNEFTILFIRVGKEMVLNLDRKTWKNYSDSAVEITKVTTCRENIMISTCL